MTQDRIFTPRKLTAAAAFSILALGLGSGAVQAQAKTGADPMAAVHPAEKLTIRDIYDRVQAAGYRDLREIELDDGRYEVKASDAQGRRVKLYVNAIHGNVERVKQKDVPHAGGPLGQSAR